jgi:hypothetical protein
VRGNCVASGGGGHSGACGYLSDIRALAILRPPVRPNAPLPAVGIALAAHRTVAALCFECDRAPRLDLSALAVIAGTRHLPEAAMPSGRAPPAPRRLPLIVSGQALRGPSPENSRG